MAWFANYVPPGPNHTQVLSGVASDSTASTTKPVIVPVAVDPASGAVLTGWRERLDQINDAVTAYAFGYNPTYISTATTTVVKTGSGVIGSVTVTGGAAGTIVIYDNTAASGTIIASFDSTAALATYLRDKTFTTGLTIVTSAATKITVAWR